MFSIDVSTIASNWMTLANKANMVLNSPLEDYKELMSDAIYNAYNNAHGQKTWYLHNMTKEATVYILAWAQI